MGRAVGDLAHHHVVIEAVPLRQAGGQQLQQGGHIQPAQQAYHRSGLAGLSHAQHLAQLLLGGRSQFLHNVYDAVTLFPPHAAEKPL